MLSSRIVEEVKHAKYFSILMDEATDCANIEQMSLVIRFVDKQFLIREDFLGFIPCTEGLSGEGYDGAGNMAGKYSGAARIMAIQEKAVTARTKYDGCSSCDVRVLSIFPKRFDLLKKIIKKELPNCRHKVIIDVCKTRWVARIDGLLNFIEAFPAIVQCLDEIKDNVDGHWNDGSTEKANGLYHSIVNFQFILVLVIVSGFLEITRPLTVQLQDSSLDANAAREKVSLLFVMLERFRSDIERKHETWFKNAADLAEAVGTLRALYSIRSHRPNTPAESILEYYRRVVSIPFLDHLISEIKKRFSERNLNILDATYGMPKNVLSNPEGWKERFSQFLNKYKDDLPQPRLLPTELEMWFEKCRLSKDSLPSNLGDVLKFADKATFPNILTGFLIFATIPVTTCTCERSVSTLRRLKTYLRNSMSESRLSALAMLNVHREIPLDIDEVIDLFAKKHPRRIILRDVIIMIDNFGFSNPVIG
ncbi:52 kDa repressor of the inhibitor of the protein kinase-like [Xenia sp. Carnegie-2017]|uniref:52 kDa repressor of the inhibitor of the protein kinase-like n=1 Tax=Xenia sp. Carnegie-2017 TaxID=2897299 RepID=UPI001F0357AA|nr:52 kDa repressor of the inhibitor of the protein kinase-like [Xenia sp. Carnegie-2017]